MKSRQAPHREWVVAASALVILAVVPFLTPSHLISDYLVRLAAFAIFATSLNILIGYGGMVSFGHAMFFGMGAYTFGLLMQNVAGLPIPLALLVAVILCAVLACVVGAICVRSQGIYFAFLTLAFSMLFYSIVLSWTSLTGGDQGLVGGIPRPLFFGIDLTKGRQLYFFSCGLAVACLWLMYLLMRSPFGYTLRMVRDNPSRALFLGIDVWRTRLYAFIMSGAFAGVSGCIMALFVSGAYPEFAYWTMSGEVIFMIMMGGLYVFLGPVLGAALLLIFNDSVTRFTDMHGIALGVIILIFALGFKRGVSDFLVRMFRTRRDSDVVMDKTA